MKNYYYVSFEIRENIYCTNIAHAENKEKVSDYYSKYPWFYIRDIVNGEVEMAREKGMPIVEI